MTTHGPGRVPGVRRLTDAIDRLDARDGAQEARTGREGSEGGVEADEPPEGLRWVDMFGVWPDHPGTDDDQAARALADMTRQRDEAVKAFQRERARVGRVEALAEDMATWCSPYGIATHYADSIRAALADRPTDDARKAREAAVSAADDAGVAGQGSDAERAGEGHA